MFKINADRPALDIERDGQKTRWEYDVVILKLEMERLEKSLGIKADDPPTAEFVEAFAKVLQSKGLDGCTADLALRVAALVKVQFNQLSFSIHEQLRAS
jgi:hypothetical protein